jgi:hypothetical protein
VPFLRVLRDKRGYETTFLMHWFRDGQRQRSRILYVFRTPPGVRVGRHVFEPATIREIEQQHPEIEFDWRSLLDNQQVVDAAPEPRRIRKRKRPDEEEGGAPASPAGPRPAPPVADAVTAAAPSPTPAAQPRITIPSAIDGTGPEEQIAWLREWHPIIRERVPHRTHDPERRDVLYALADRLNPDSWIGDEAIAQGLRDAADALMRLSRVFAKRRRRPRKAGGGGRDGGSSGGAEGRTET